MSSNITKIILSSLFICSGHVGCAEDLGDPSELEEEDTHAKSDGDEEGESGKISHTAEDDATMTAVDATDEEAWVYFDLDAVEVGGASGEVGEDDDGWDLGLRRSSIKLNGGTSGDGAVEISYSDALAFDGVDELPSDLTWSTDGEMSDEEGEAVLALDDWYDYDVMNHTLSPKDRTYFVRTSDADIFKFMIVGYYSAAGTPAHLGLRWVAL